MLRPLRTAKCTETVAFTNYLFHGVRTIRTGHTAVAVISILALTSVKTAASQYHG